MTHFCDTESSLFKPLGHKNKNGQKSKFHAQHSQAHAFLLARAHLSSADHEGHLCDTCPCHSNNFEGYLQYVLDHRVRQPRCPRKSLRKRGGDIAQKLRSVTESHRVVGNNLRICGGCTNTQGKHARWVCVETGPMEEAERRG